MSGESKTRPPQVQDKQPGIESEMRPRPRFAREHYKPAGKLLGKKAIVTGGDSGIGRSVAVHFAMEGADVVIAYLNETDDAQTTKRLVEGQGRKCVTFAGDLGDEPTCRQLVDQAVKDLGGIDVLVNNAAEQHPESRLEDISSDQLERTFRTNIFAYFYMARTALEHIPEGGAIINCTSVTAYRGSPHLIDYAATKGAIVAFTRSLALAVADRGVRVNGVAPGPIWTPLIPASFDEKKVETFGANVPLGRPGEPDEVAPAFVFLASVDSSYMTGQVLHPNGGEIVNA